MSLLLYFIIDFNKYVGKTIKLYVHHEYNHINSKNYAYMKHDLRINY